jgi:GT2 family glycosyltransferase
MATTRAAAAVAVIVPATDRPSTLDACIAALAPQLLPDDELIVVRDGPRDDTPAAARNRGVLESTRSVLVFVDADVIAGGEAISRLRRRMIGDASLTAVFGAYDDAPQGGVVSVFRNLLHHYVHAGAAGPVRSFWSGLGAVRRDAFVAAGGFDPSVRYLEDVELGWRMTAAGARIELDPTVCARHLKRYGLVAMARTDAFERAAPWMRLALAGRAPRSALNAGGVHRIGGILALACTTCLLIGRRRAGALAFAGIVVLHRRLYALLWRRLGLRGALAGPLLHVLHHHAAALGAAWGAASALWGGGERSMQADHPETAVIVPTCGRPDALARCLGALAAGASPSGRFEVIVVADGPQPQTALVVAAAAARGLPVRLVAQPHGGAATARNRGVRASSARLLAFVDDDCLPAAGWLGALVARLERQPDAVLGGRIVNARPDLVASEASQLTHDAVTTWLARHAPAQMFFATANLGCSRATFESLGGFDERLGRPAAEDRDFCMRAHAAGHELLPVPEAIVGHDRALGVRSFVRQHYRYGTGLRSLADARRQAGAASPRSPLALYPDLARAALAYGGVRMLALIGLGQAAYLGGVLRAEVAARRHASAGSRSRT